MTEAREIARLRARIQRQRERLGHDEAPEPVVAEAMPDDGRFVPRRATGGHKGASLMASLGRTLADHPVLAMGIGAAVLVAGPQRSLRLARHAVRGAVFVLGAYRGASAVLGLLGPARRPGDPGRREFPPEP